MEMNLNQTAEQNQDFAQRVNDARAAAFLHRASVTAMEVVNANDQGIVGHALDKLKREREHWASLAQPLIKD